ncbi:hypothetical protein BH23PLA1_BH23PLA1_32000 [soil metagenome]
MSEAEPTIDMVWTPDRPPWGWKDALALVAWTAAITGFFWDLITFQSALFYFDITEINLPYRDFLANELKAGRFSRWHPGLYCGLPLFSESQAGYLHPLKYPLYPFLSTWQAFNLDTVLSVWLTGIGAYGWLRRHVGAIGALTGASVFGLSGFVWAHLFHTSMANALVSVPFAFWALECAWDGGRLRGMALGAVALACQVFAGHLQDTLLTGLALGLYGLYRAVIERGWRPRLYALGTTAGLGGLGIALSAVQWIPSVELLNRSPRAGGLTWEELTYGSWHPELLPTVVVREAYGTRARDTDWMDGYYPYHEMNTYMGLVAIGLAIIGAAAYRDRWVAFWVLLAGIGSMLMLGKFTFLLDYANKLPFLGSSRIPVRFHLWVSLAVAALAAVGADRLARPGKVRLRWATAFGLGLVVLSIPILYHVYEPFWNEPRRSTGTYQHLRNQWLIEEWKWATIRTAILVILGGLIALVAARTARPGPRQALAALLPVVVIADLLGAHWHDVARIDPAYWTDPPASVSIVQADPDHQRVFGNARFHAGEPGYASTDIDFMAVRDTLAWSLPPVWGLASAIGETPMIPRRFKSYTDAASIGGGRFEVEGVSHVLSGMPGRLADWPPPTTSGTAYLYRNPQALPRARLLGRPIYVEGEQAASTAVRELGRGMRDRVIVEDPDDPLDESAEVVGRAEITVDEPERVVVETESETDAYLVLADTFDPGWTARIEGQPVPIRPAFVTFRAVFLPAGRHEVVFTYTPAGFWSGLALTLIGLVIALFFLLWSRRLATLGPAHGSLGWPRSWPGWGLTLMVAILLGSAFAFGGPRGFSTHQRWEKSLHRFTWGAGIDAMSQVPWARKQGE